MGIGAWARIIGASIVVLGTISSAQQTSSLGPLPLDAILQAMQRAQAAVRPPVSYQVIREYRLSGAKDSRTDSEVVAEVNFRPPGSKDYRIQRSSGSSRGEQLVRRVLDHEVEATSNKTSSAISPNNYNFSYLGEATVDGKACYVLGLAPKRNEKDLISGRAWIDKHSFFVRQVEGVTEKTPSWWLKQVHVKLVFAEREGIWIQTNMEAVADVRIVGSHTLTSQVLDYRRQDEVAATPVYRSSAVRKR